MFIVGCLLGGLLLGKAVTLTGGFIYDITKGKEDDRKWAEFIILYRQLKAEHIMRIEQETKK